MHTEQNTNNINTNTNNKKKGDHNKENREYNQEYGEEYTTMCTQCKRVLVKDDKKSAGIPIRVSDEGKWVNYDSLPAQKLTRSMSHGLCRSCFNNVNTSLLSTATQSCPSSLSFSPLSSPRKRTILSQSLSSPQFSRHLPSRPKRVLIVDDNRLQRQIHKRMVEQLGYECDVALSGEQALEMIEKHSYFFILMDLVMAPMDGWTAAKKIRASLLQSLGFASSIPKIVAVTGLAVDEKLIDQCKDSGMEDVMQKPISTDKLRKVLHKQTSPAMKVDR